MSRLSPNRGSQCYKGNPLAHQRGIQTLVISSGGLLEEKNEEEVSRWKESGKVGEQPTAKTSLVLQVIGGLQKLEVGR